MPKKTKKQKIIAHERRHHHHPMVNESREYTRDTPVSPSGNPMYKFNESSGITRSPVVPPSVFGESMMHIKHDMTKTLFLAVAACVILIALSFILH